MFAEALCCACNLSELFNWLDLGCWESLLRGTFQSLAVILLRVIILTSLVHHILSRVLHDCQQPGTSQMVSIRIRHLDEINNKHTDDEDGKTCPSGLMTQLDTLNVTDTLWPDSINSGNQG